MDGEEISRLHGETRTAADTLQPRAAEAHELARKLEELTKDTSAWYAGTRARVEDRAVLEQAEELQTVLKELVANLSARFVDWV